ncbi:MAG: hypothetical protein QXK80_00865 [Candidatus Pacearchaeota archaeon]
MEEKSRHLIVLILMILFIVIIVTEVIFLITGTRINLLVKNNLHPEPGITAKEVYGYISIFILPRCNFPLGPGWNFFSLCADPEDKRINSSLGSTSYRYVLRWNTTRMEWDIYSPRASENPFENFTTNESFFVLVYDNETIFFAGNESGDMNITMVEGWNAPSWPYLFDTNISKYFNETKHRYMMKWSNPLQEFVIYSPRASEKPFTEIFKSEGQMLYAYNDHILIYNKTYLQDP